MRLPSGPVARRGGGPPGRSLSPHARTIPPVVGAWHRHARICPHQRTIRRVGTAIHRAHRPGRSGSTPGSPVHYDERADQVTEKMVIHRHR